MIANYKTANARKMENPESDKELIEALIAHTNMSASAIARKANLAVTTLTRPLNKPVNHSLSLTTVKKLKEIFPDFPGFAQEGDLPRVSENRSYLEVDILPSFAGAGGGGSGDADGATGLVSRALVEDELHAKPTDLLLIDVRGDSMEPDFLHGDQILIDKRDTNPVQPGPFALWDGEGYVIKLLERVPRSDDLIKVFSANDRYSPYEVLAEELRIMGRPVWFARRL